jgi:ABC-type nitrate/sulfonate/bicarbonate transport system permease component
MKHSAQRFDTAGLLSIIVLLAFVGLAAQEGLKALEARLLPWHVRR